MYVHMYTDIIFTHLLPAIIATLGYGELIECGFIRQLWAVFHTY